MHLFSPVSSFLKFSDFDFAKHTVTIILILLYTYFINFFLTFRVWFYFLLPYFVFALVKFNFGKWTIACIEDLTCPILCGSLSVVYRHIFQCYFVFFFFFVGWDFEVLILFPGLVWLPVSWCCYSMSTDKFSVPQKQITNNCFVIFPGFGKWDVLIRFQGRLI